MMRWLERNRSTKGNNERKDMWQVKWTSCLGLSLG
jgi:hypothetical protein